MTLNRLAVRATHRQFIAEARGLETDFHTAVGRERDRRHDRPGVGEIDRPERGFARRRRVEEIAERAEARVEQIVDQAIELHVLSEVVGGVQVDLGVAAERRGEVGLIAIEENWLLAAMRSAPNFHCRVIQ